MFLGIGLSQLPSVFMKTIKRMKQSKPKLEGTLRKYTIKRRNTGCYTNSSVVLQKEATNECQPVLESSSVANGPDGRHESYRFKHVGKSSLKTKKNVITTPIEKDNRSQTRDELQLRILKLEERLDKISESLNNKTEKEEEVT